MVTLALSLALSLLAPCFALFLLALYVTLSLPSLQGPDLSPIIIPLYEIPATCPCQVLLSDMY